MIQADVVMAEPGHCRALYDALEPEALNFLRVGWGVDPLMGIEAAFRASPLCWSVLLDGGIAAMFGCASGYMAGVGSPWLITAPALEAVKLRFIRQSRGYARLMLEEYPVLTANVYRGNKPLIGWMKWLGFEFEDVDEIFMKGVLRSWDCRWF